MLRTDIPRASFGIQDVVNTLLLVITQQLYFFSIHIYVYSDTEAKFRERDEREEQLIKAKEKLENDIAAIMKMSGDNSSQLTKMNDELRLKERYVRVLLRASALG